MPCLYVPDFLANNLEQFSPFSKGDTGCCHTKNKTQPQSSHELVLFLEASSREEEEDVVLLGSSEDDDGVRKVVATLEQRKNSGVEQLLLLGSEEEEEEEEGTTLRQKKRDCVEVLDDSEEENGVPKVCTAQKQRKMECVELLDDSEEGEEEDRKGSSGAVPFLAITKSREAGKAPKIDHHGWYDVSTSSHFQEG
ncbi:MAG: hypothetical protein ACREOZ_00800 [Gloeomargaritales cyanobacterium]